MTDYESFIRAYSALFCQLSEDDPTCVWDLCLPPGCDPSAVARLERIMTDQLLAVRLCSLRSVPLLRSLANASDDELQSLYHCADYLQLPVDAVCKKLTLQMSSEKLRLRVADARPLSHLLLDDEHIAPYFNRTKFLLDLFRLPGWLCSPLRMKSRVGGLLHGLCGDSFAAASCCLSDEYHEIMAADDRAARAARTLRLRVAWLSGLIVHSWLARKLSAGVPTASLPAADLPVTACGGAGTAEGGASSGAATAAADGDEAPSVSAADEKVEPSLLRTTWLLSDAEGAAITEGPAFLLSPVLIAAYLGRVDWLQALSNADWPLFNNRCQVNGVLFAAAGGHVPVLQWLLGGAADAGLDARAYAWTPQCARMAARNGHVAVLAWARERGLMDSAAHELVSSCYAQAAVGAAEGASEAALRWLLASASLSLNGSRVFISPDSAAMARSSIGAAVVKPEADDRRVLPWRLPVNALNAVADIAATNFDGNWGVAWSERGADGAGVEGADDKADESSDDTADDDNGDEEEDEDEDEEGPFGDGLGGHRLVEAAAAARGATADARLAALRCLVLDARCSVTASALMAAAELGDVPALDFLLPHAFAGADSGSPSAAATHAHAGGTRSVAVSGHASAEKRSVAGLYASALQGIALAASANGHVAVIQWLADRGVLAPALSPSVMRAAVGSGSIPLLQLLRKSEPPCPWGAGLVALARRKGRADVAAWLRGAGYPATPAEDTHLCM